jgi:hypothetical protein
MFSLILNTGVRKPVIIGRDESMKSSFIVIASLLLVISSTALGDTPMDRILSALEAGEITDAEAADLLLQSVTEYESLPSRFVDGTDAVRCGTPALQEAYHLSGDTDFANRPVMSGPEYTITSPDGHFVIHWTDSGADAVSATYANSVAEAADSSWDIECDQMNFFTPPPDNGVGGNDLYDMYIKMLSGGTLGYTTHSGEYHPPDSTHSCSASHIVIGSTISGTGMRNCTVSHEFQHAIQMSYDYNEATWFMENCAVWMEEMVYPTVNDYLGYLSYGENALRSPWMDIRSGSMYWYGALTWPWMMWDRWDYEAVREVWELCAATTGNNTVQAHEDMFNNHGTCWENFFMDYGLWRWFTASNWNSSLGLMYCAEAATWTPGPRVLPWHVVTSLPFSGDQGPAYLPDTWGIHWIEVDLSSYQDQWIQFAFDGRDYFEWNLGVIMQDNGNNFSFKWYNCDPTTGEYTVTIGADGWDSAIFFPAFVDLSPLDHNYTFDITLLGTGIEEDPATSDLLNLSVSSNPIQSGGFVTFDLPTAGNANLRVYDMSGRTAAVLLDEDMQAGSHSVQFAGDNLSDGTYFIMLFANDQISAQKVVLTR